MEIDLLLDHLMDVPLATQGFVVISACEDELVTHLVFLVDVCLHLVLVHDRFLDVQRLLLELQAVLKLVFFKVNAPQVVHTRPQFVQVVQLCKDLSDLMVVEQSLIVVTFI